MVRRLAILAALIALALPAAAGIGTVDIRWNAPKSKVCTAPAAALNRGCEVATDCGTGGVCSTKRCTAGTVARGTGCSIGSDCGTGGICSDVDQVASYQVSVTVVPGDFDNGTISTVATAPGPTGTPFRIGNLDDCKDTYVSVRAIGATAGKRSAWAPIASGPTLPWFAKMRVDSIAPVAWVVGETQSITVTGANFKGTLQADLLQPVSGPALSGTATANNCSTATVSFNIPGTTPTGPRVLRLTSSESSAEKDVALVGIVFLVAPPESSQRADPR